MAKRLTSVLGIDIGSQQIKLAEVKMQGRERTISALGVIDTPEGTVDHTGVYDTDQIGTRIKELIAQTGASASHIVVSVAGQASVLVRTLEVPKMNPAELKEHMQWEITRNIPFAESTVESDFRAFETIDPSAMNMDVVMAIAPESAVQTLVGIIKKAGKQPHAIDVEPLGLARSLVQSYDADFHDKTVCIVEIGNKSTSINMYKDGQLLLPRQIPLGGENFTSAIADNLGYDIPAAEAIKREKGRIPDSASVAAAANPFGDMGAETQGFAPYNPFADDPAMSIPDVNPAPYDPTASMTAAPDPMAPYNPFAEQEPAMATPDVPMFDPMAPAAMDTPAVVPVSVPATTTDDPETVRIYNAFAGILDEFLGEVRRSVDYFRSKGGEVDFIKICGGGAKLAGLDSFLEKTLGIPTSKLDPTRGMNIAAKRLDPRFVDQHREDLAIAIGNGLHICFD